MPRDDASAATVGEGKVTIDLPGPHFRGLRQRGIVYVALNDVIDFLGETADAFDRANANADIGKSFRACRASIEEARVEEAS